MSAYKFLARGAVGPLTGFQWPAPRGSTPGAWVEVEGSLAQCARGVHVSGPLDLAHWLHDELWEVETDGDQIEGIDCLIVRRARLVRCIGGWNERGSLRFAEACIEHSTSLTTANSSDAVRGFLEDAREAARGGYIAVSAFCAALAISKSAVMGDEEKAYRDERRWQANWIVRDLIAN
jgi:hypothetical protein